MAALVLSAFLCGIAVATLFVKRFITDSFTGLVRVLVFIMGVVSVYSISFYFVPDALGLLLEHMTVISASQIVQLCTIWVFLFIPGFLIGATFPVLLELQKHFFSNQLSISALYACDVLGGTVGALMAGFFILPSFGVPIALLVAAICSLIAFGSTAVLLPAPQRYYYGAATGFLLALIMLRVVYTNAESDSQPIALPYDQRFEAILFQEPSPYGVVTVGETFEGDQRHMGMHINYRGMCHTQENGSERFIAQTAATNAPADAKALAIGLGCGFTLNELLQYPIIKQVDLFEINPVIAANTTAFFFTEAEDPLHNPKVTLTVASGMQALENASDGSYEVVVIDVEEPDIIQSSPLYTQEYFREAKRVLSDDGVFALWAVRGGERYNKILYQTLSTVFPHVYLTAETQATGVQLFAAQKPLMVADSTQLLPSELVDIPINKLYHNVLQDQYSIEEYFKLPEHFSDPYIE